NGKEWSLAFGFGFLFSKTKDPRSKTRTRATNQRLMYKFIWLVPLLPLAGAAINGIFGRWFRFSEKLIGGIAVGSVALSFLISVSAVYSYGFSGSSQWPNPYLTSQDGYSFNWIPSGAVSVNQGAEARHEAEAQKQIQEQRSATT